MTLGISDWAISSISDKKESTDQTFQIRTEFLKAIYLINSSLYNFSYWYMFSWTNVTPIPQILHFRVMDPNILISRKLQQMLTSWWRHQMETFSVILGPLWGESTGYHTKTSDAELWCFLWSAPQQTVEQTIETPVIWDAIALIMTSLWCDKFYWWKIHIALIDC